MKYLLLFILTFSGAYSQKKSEYFLKVANEQLELNRLDEAIKNVDIGLASDSLNTDLILLKVKVLYKQEKCSDAILILQDAVLIDNKLNDVTVSYYADILDCLKYYDKVDETLEDYVMTNKSSEILNRLGQRFYGRKEYDKSIKYYSKLVSEFPKDVDAIIDYSRVLYGLGKFEDLKKITVEGLKNNKNNLKLLNNMASYYFITKNYKAGIDVENTIIKLQYSVDNIASRAMFYEKNGQNEEAYSDYKKIIELEKCNIEYYKKILNYEFEKKLYANVIENSRKAIKCDSSNEETVLEGLYTSLLFEGQFIEAKMLLDKKLSLNPKQFSPFYLKLLILFSEKKYSEADQLLTSIDKKIILSNEERQKIDVLRLAYYLAVENYADFAKHYSKDSLQGVISERELTREYSSIQNTEVIVEFRKSLGDVNFKIIVPAAIVKFLSDNYTVSLTF